MYQAELYSRSNDACVEIVSSSLGKYGHLLDLDAAASVLELGIGDGRVTEWLLLGGALPADVAYVGTDVSVEMVEFARRRDALGRHEVDVLDATTATLPERFRGRFDATIAFNLLHSIPRIEQALNNIYDTLKPSGITYFVFLGYTPHDYPFEKISRCPKWAKYGSEKWCSQFYKNHEVIPNYYEKAMLDIGFKDVKCFYDVFKTKFKSAVFRGLMVSINRVIRDVPEEDRNEYVEDYLEEIMKQDFVQTCREGDEDVVNVTLPVYTVYAKK